MWVFETQGRKYRQVWQAKTFHLLVVFFSGKTILSTAVGCASLGSVSHATLWLLRVPSANGGCGGLVRYTRSFICRVPFYIQHMREIIRFLTYPA